MRQPRRTYSTWSSMMHRCNNPQRREYKNYGGRGISVCTRWSSFVEFKKDMGERPLGKVLDRINNDGNYEPDNCRWVTHKENCRNRSTARMLTYKGCTKSLTEWSETLGINMWTLRTRIRDGQALERIFSSQELCRTLKTHCKRGHLYDEKNTYYPPNSTRQCRRCRK